MSGATTPEPAARRSYFLPYQEAWLRDDSRLKIAEKSRRIGWTYTQAYEDVRDAAKKGGMDVWFSSADQTAAAEYILYCGMWAQLLNLAAKDLGEIVLDKDDDIKARVIEFANGKRIHGMSSNPKGFRSKGGKIVLDEYAFHEQQDELWKAAGPSALWGYPIRVFSSHNGKGTRFYRMCEDAQREESRWSPHRVTLEDAIADGLVEKIKDLDRPATEEEVAEFIAECKDIAGDEETYQQEFMCNPQDDKASFIAWDLIYGNEHADVPEPIVILGKEVNDIPQKEYEPAWSFEPSKNRYFLGVDIGRQHDLTVLWLLEEIGDVYWTALVIELHQMKFGRQEKNLHKLLPFARRACIDATGLGMQLAEQAQEAFGESKVEPITFTNAVKEDLAITLKRGFEDRQLRNPGVKAVRDDIHKIKKIVTASNNVRFDAASDDEGHADRFWALALARHAAGTARGPIEAKRTQPGRSDQFRGRGW